MKCPTCDTDIPGYRDNARPPAPPTPRAPLLSIKIEKGAIARLSYICAGVIACMFVLHGASSVHKEIEDNKRYHKQWEDKMGYVLVQYEPQTIFTKNINPRAIRCWVMPPAYYWYNGGHTIVGPTYPGTDMHMPPPDNVGWMEVPDRNDIDGFARHMGVADPSTCMR